MTTQMHVIRIISQVLASAIFLDFVSSSVYNEMTTGSNLIYFKTIHE